MANPFDHSTLWNVEFYPGSVNTITFLAPLQRPLLDARTVVFRRLAP
jgi:hypothetical protein